MAYKYQLIFLGDIKNNACNTIKVRFFEKILSIGLNSNMFELVYVDTFFEKYSNKQPTFAFYFGDINHSEKDIDALKVLLDNGDAILPIYFGENFEAEVPEIIHVMIVICIVYQHITYPYIKNSSTNSNLVDYAIQANRDRIYFSHCRET